MITLFKKIPLSIQPSFWILSFFIGFLNSTAPLQIFFWIGVVLLSVVVHELGHALTAIYWGQRVRIELTAFGGVTIREKGAELTPLKEFFCIAMGPLAGFLLAAVVYIIPASSQAVASALYTIVVANIIWSMLNLLPVHPLDGGKLMAIVFENFFGHAGLRFSYFLSALLAIVFGLTFMILHSVLMSSFFLLFAFESFRAWKQAKFKGRTDVENQITEEIDKAIGEWLSEKPDAAIQRLEKLCDESQGQSDAYIEALEKLAHYLIMTKQPKKAFQRLMGAKNRLSIQGLALLQLAAFEAEAYQEALKAGEKLYIEGVGGSDCALLNAFSAAHLQKADVTVNWLKSVQKEGENEASFDMATILKSEELNPVRSSQTFKDFAGQSLSA